MITAEVILKANVIFAAFVILFKWLFVGIGPSEKYPGIWVMLIVVFNGIFFLFS